MPPEVDALLGPPLVRAAYADRTAWIMAACSALAYVKFESGQEQVLRDSLNAIRLDLSATFNRQGTQGFLAGNRRFSVLAFRGTERDWGDILTDLKIRFYRDQSGAKIASGFSDAYARVEQDVTRELARLDPDLPLYITGHSLGGAIATVASMRIHPVDRIAACYTFGSPRVGNGEFVLQLWKVPVYRVVHAADIVTRVPLPFGYRHAGDVRYIKRSGQLIKSPGSVGLLASFTYTAATNWRKMFSDHHIAAYAENLKSWALGRQETPEGFSPKARPASAR